jgi:Uncharacterized conserved protein (COG2071).
MRLPKVHGIIRRRLLVNFRIDPAVARAQLPQPFTPKLYSGYAVGGICLIRLEGIRPKRFPRLLGLSSENAAHRFAVTWTDPDGEHEGVYIPRRDSDSMINHLAGGRLFPGEHHFAKFAVTDSGDQVGIDMTSADRSVAVRVAAATVADFPSGSIFPSLEEASAFFEPGSLGYSATAGGHQLDGIVLRTHRWEVSPLLVQSVESSFFSNESLFPRGSVSFDCALIMRNIAHEWHSAKEMYV